MASDICTRPTPAAKIFHAAIRLISTGLPLEIALAYGYASAFGWRLIQCGGRPTTLGRSTATDASPPLPTGCAGHINDSGAAEPFQPTDIQETVLKLVARIIYVRAGNARAWDPTQKVNKRLGN